MTRYLFGFIFVLALGVMGCGETAGTGGSGGDGGSAGMGGDGGAGGMPECETVDNCLDDFSECTTTACTDGTCTYPMLENGTACDEDNECTIDGACADGECVTTPVTDDTACGDDAGTCQQGSCEVACTEQGIRDAIAAGGGPYTFDCPGPTNVVIGALLLFDKDVALDGEGNLTIDGNGIVAADGDSVKLIDVVEGVTAEIRGLTIIVKSYANNGRKDGLIQNSGGTLVLFESSVLAKVADRGRESIFNFNGTLALINCAIWNAGIASWGTPDRGNLTIVNSTVSAGGTLGMCGGTFTMVNSTFSTNSGGLRLVLSGRDCGGSAAFIGSLVDGDCNVVGPPPLSNGYNIESPGDTCGFDQPTDQVNVTKEQLNLGELADNGGPTMTHALGAGSVAIDKIPADTCEVDEDQRGIGRPQGDACDVGAFEVQEGSL